MSVLITGLGAYDISGIDSVNENASWEGVKRINKDEIKEKLGFDFVIENLPVSYNEVYTRVSKLWEEYQQFELAIHVGLAKGIERLILEKQARKGQYGVIDCEGCIPDGQLHPSEGMDCYTTAFDLEAILEEFNSMSPEQITAEMSDDAGKFLCEFIYYTSLHHSESKKVLFVHVPHGVYSYEQLAIGLERLLELILKQYY